MRSPTKQFYRIREVAAMLDVPTSTLRYWENEFTQLVPVRLERGQRRYTQDNIELFRRIKEVLHEKGIKVKMAKELINATYRKNAPRNPYVCKTSEDAINLLRDVTKMIGGNPHAEERLKAVANWIENSERTIIHKNIRGKEYFNIKKTEQN